ncbi:uncharacterized protein H6S33_009295 [Morchella sextelata]|uniref:Uncharacterized protein n=1 Tax=Morchella conica CCBAS932 TaxID=1392247 RepID=A0A3N4L0H2_9PEZI|nr:uncharacterized protein H6S33_009295 [Morchella sextelata]KAH0612915.1 hypothetical protein H6S33_009295 [Morchella sextelata]RPB16324.1 hypothetical protein P167DRAFT_570563 [Morchella conica CCBAS932]
MPTSLESSTPMISKRDTRRFSTYTNVSSDPSIAGSEKAAFFEIESGLRRMEDRRLMSQRFVPTEQKSEMISKLALGAKLERALRWRMDKQDAVARPRSKSG